MYKVIKYFEDLKDNRHPYKVGDIFPRNGLEVSESRIDELSRDKNKRGEPLIVEVVTPKKRKAKEK
jgi:hypothetical protein